MCKALTVCVPQIITTGNGEYVYICAEESLIVTVPHGTLSLDTLVSGRVHTTKVQCGTWVAMATLVHTDVVATGLKKDSV